MRIGALDLDVRDVRQLEVVLTGSESLVYVSRTMSLPAPGAAPRRHLFVHLTNGAMHSTVEEIDAICREYIKECRTAGIRPEVLKTHE